MAQSLARVLAHLVFSTKHRRRFLRDRQIREELYAYTATIFREMDSPALTINGTDDHIHILFSLSRTHSIANVVETIKKKPSKWIKTKGHEYAEFRWQAGHGIFSVSQSKVEELKRYIARQEEHHKTLTFKEEFRALWRMHGIDFDERYVWD